MELCGKKVLFPDARNERLPICGEGRNPLYLLWNDIIGVHKIEEVTTLYPLKQRDLLLLIDSIPTHMRDLMPWIGSESNHLSMDQVQTLMGSKFLAF